MGSKTHSKKSTTKDCRIFDMWFFGRDRDARNLDIGKRNCGNNRGKRIASVG